MTFITELETGKLHQYLGDISVVSKGPIVSNVLRIVQDVETDVIKMYPFLDKFRAATQDEIDKVGNAVQDVVTVTDADNAKQTASSIPAPSVSVAPTVDASIGLNTPPVPVVPDTSGLDGTGITPSNPQG